MAAFRLARPSPAGTKKDQPFGVGPVWCWLGAAPALCGETVTLIPWAALVLWIGPVVLGPILAVPGGWGLRNPRPKGPGQLNDANIPLRRGVR